MEPMFHSREASAHYLLMQGVRRRAALRTSAGAALS
jgi:hypothetical protein